MAMHAYQHWLDVARRYSRRADDAEDLLQDALLAALKARRRPLENAADAPWFHGVIRKHAAMRARTAVRERARNASATIADRSEDLPAHDVHETEWREIAALPNGLRRVLVLTLSGLGRAEIRRVLDISDTALRQRLRALRKHIGDERQRDFHALAATYAARLAQNTPPDGGLRRAALAHGPAKLDAFRFAIADPDSNMLAISGKASRNDPPRQQQDESRPNNRPDETE